MNNKAIYIGLCLSVIAVVGWLAGLLVALFFFQKIVIQEIIIACAALCFIIIGNKIYEDHKSPAEPYIHK